MSAWWVVLGVVIVVAVCLGVLWCTWTAGRLDRMHLRLETARASLDALLQRRTSIAAELAAGGLSDPASALVLLEVARTARDTGPDEDRWALQSELTATLRAVDLSGDADEPLVERLVETSRQASMARRIHNDLASTTRQLHERRRVRWFRLAGHAPLPESIDFDDGSDFASPPG